jgi:hypothetical protein
MVQPIQYTVKAPSAFESLVSGLKLGTSLQDIQLRREQQMAAMQQAQEKAEAERQRQARLQMLRGKSFSQWTPDDVLSASDLLPKESLTFLKGQMDQMSTEERRARALTLGQLGSVALMGDAERTSAAFDERIEAETNPREKEALRAQKQIALTRPEDLAKMYVTMLPAMGDEGKQVADNLLKVRGLEKEKPAAEPEKIRILRAAGLEPTLENIGKLAAAERAPNADIAMMDVLGLPKTEAGYARLNELRQSGSGPLVTVQAGQPAPPSEFEKKVESVAADVYADWALKGGAANARARIAQLGDVVKSLERSAKGRGPTLTGVQIQLIPEFARPLLVPSSLEARQNAERVIQDGLRAILGAQFTQVEGENFLKRAFDPNLGPDVNARRLSLILEQMKESAKQAQALSDYVEKNRTARGFNGVIPSLAQFEGALARVPAQQRGQQGAADRPAERKPASQLSNEEILRRLGGQ